MRTWPSVDVTLRFFTELEKRNVTRFVTHSPAEHLSIGSVKYKTARTQNVKEKYDNECKSNKRGVRAFKYTLCYSNLKCM